MEKPRISSGSSFLIRLCIYPSISLSGNLDVILPVANASNLLILFCVLAH